MRKARKGAGRRLGSARHHRAQRRRRRRYADATGGRVFFPLRIQEVTSAFKEIQDELRSQYVLAYKPENFVQNGSYRSIVLEVPKRSNVKIRVRKGYYAPKG